MTYFSDLDQKTMVAQGAAVRAIGWLARGREFAEGPTSREFVAALKLLRTGVDASREILKLPMLMGPHVCEFCGKDVDTGEIVVPSGDILYLAPRMIVHYVERHAYRPPAEFIEAVMACPATDTPPTLKRSFSRFGQA